ncbi:MAG: lytic transglycosylase domain-containing protein [Comamonadaceae bacterium]|nr:MAG: lytic transglycosylase domain-containing protein [Comamonadaceae bacterium]
MLLHAAPARADVWGYVDDKGVAHFASEKLDERYEVFFRGNESFAVGGAAGVGQAAAPSSSTGAAPGSPSPRLLAFFDISPNYKAVKHLLRDASTIHGIDYELLQALIATESGFDTNAVSPKGAVGLMQLIPPTAQRYGVRADKNSPIHKKLTDPKTNIRAGSSYLRDLIDMFPGQLELAIAAYNAGEGAVQRAGNKIPNYPETRNYVKTVMQLYTHLKPPVAFADARKTRRVRMEMMGGATGRGNLPAALGSSGQLTAPAVVPLAPVNTPPLPSSTLSPQSSNGRELTVAQAPDRLDVAGRAGGAGGVADDFSPSSGSPQ